MTITEIEEKGCFFGNTEISCIYFNREKDFLTHIKQCFYRPALSESIRMSCDGNIKYSCGLPIPTLKDGKEKIAEGLIKRGWKFNGHDISKEITSAIELIKSIAFSNAFAKTVEHFLENSNNNYGYIDLESEQFLGCVDVKALTQLELPINSDFSKTNDFKLIAMMLVFGGYVQDIWTVDREY